MGGAFLLLCFGGSAASAAVPLPPNRLNDYRSIANGVFTNPAIWEVFVAGTSGTASDGYYTPATAAPTTAAATVYVSSGTTVTVNSAVTIDELVVEYGSILEHSGTNNLTIASGASAFDIIVQGTYRELSIISGLVVAPGATALVDETGIWRHSANGGSIPAATWSPSSLLFFDGVTTATTLTGRLGQEFGRITWNCPAQTSTFTLGPVGPLETAAVTTAVAGDMTVISTGTTGRLQLASTTRTLPVSLNANYIQTGGRVLVNAVVSGSRSLNVAGDFTVQGGNFTVNAAVGGLATGQLQVDGALNLNAGALNITQGTRPGSVAVTGDVSLSVGATLQTTGSGTATFNFAQGPRRKFQNAGTVSGSILFNANGGANVDFADQTLTGTGTFTLADGAEASFGSPNGITAIGQSDQNLGNIRVGSITPFQRTYSPLGYYIYNGTGPQATGSGLPTEIGAASAVLYAGGLGINNTGATPTVTLSRSVLINSDLLLARGRLISSAASLLTLSSTAELSLQGSGSDTAYVQGVLQRQLDDTQTLYEYPIGDAMAYRPLAVRLEDSTGEATYAVTVDRSPVVNPVLNRGAGNNGLRALVGDTRWQVERTAGFTNGIFRLPIPAGISPDPTLLTVAGYNTLTNQWDNLSIVARDFAAGWIEGLVPPEYSQITFGQSMEDPLPVELLRFTAVRRGNVVALAWATASERNSSYFAVERSANGRDFRELTRVTAAGSSSVQREYAAIDGQPLTSVAYYRLRQVDNDGKMAYSDIVAVKPGTGAVAALAIYPNPATETLHVELPTSGPGTVVQIVNSVGQEVLRFTPDALTATVTCNVAALPAGSYIVTVSAPGQPRATQRLLKTVQ